MPKINNSIDESLSILNSRIANAEYGIAKCKFVQNTFPDAKVSIIKNINDNDIFKFSSKLVNNNYTKYEFSKYTYALTIKVFTELEFTYNGNTEIIKINSSPETCRLARLGWSYDKHKGIIRFSRFSFNMKKNNFKGDIFNDCRAHIMQFIQANPNCDLDTKHLEPRLKKLLLFT